MLRETEWMTINHILLDIYMVNDIEILTKKVMKGLRLLIPHSKGYFMLFDENQEPLLDNICFVGFDAEELKAYINESYEEDYLKYLLDITSKTPIYQESNILMDNIRMFTPFYTNFLKTVDCPYGGGLLLIHDNRIIGILEIFRSGELVDFNEKDIYILNVLKKHIENIVFRTIQLNKEQTMDERCFVNMKKRFELTDREDDILRLVSKGFSNQEIRDKLIISDSTVKKHIYNIYSKTGVINRTQLLNLLYIQING